MKKNYLLLCALGFSLSAWAQSNSKGNALPPPLQVESISSSSLDEVRNIRHYNSSLQNYGKAAGDILFTEDFADGFSNGWTNDLVNVPAGVNPIWLWEHAFEMEGGSLTDPYILSETADDGFATLNLTFIRENSNTTAIVEPCWSGLTSPVIDLSDAVGELDQVSMGFTNVYRHCCKFDLQMGVDFSFDGGATFPLTQRINILAADVEGLERKEPVNDAMASNVTVLDIGSRVLEGRTEAELQNVVFRFTWDSSVSDGNGQTSTEYFWAIDDIAIYVAPTHDFKISAAYPGDGFNNFDYRQVPQAFLENYPITAVVKNDGSEAGLFTLNANLQNTNSGTTLSYNSGELLLPAFSEEVIEISAFSDYDPNTDYTGEWEITYSLSVNENNPDFRSNGQDTAATLSIHVTDNTWAHTTPWQGDFLRSRQKFDDGTYPPTPHLSMFRVPSNIQSIEVSTMAVAWHDDLDTVPIGMPNQIELSFDEGVFDQDSWSNSAPAYYHYNEDEGEVDGLVFLDASNRDRRITQIAQAVEPFNADYVSGNFANPLTGGVETITMTQQPDGSGYWVKFTPTEVIHMAAGGIEADNSTVFFGPFSSGAATGSWFGLGSDEPTPIMELTVIAVNGQTVGISEKQNTDNPFELEIYPNPAKDFTQIQYRLNEAAKVQITVTDLMGKTVFASHSKSLSSGIHTVKIDVQNFTVGVYFYTLAVDNKQYSKKMVIAK